MRRVFAIFLCASLVGCATLDESAPVQIMSSDAAAIGCQALDAATTVWALGHASVHEANPLMAGVLKAGGIPLFLVLKIAMALFMTSDSINPTVAAVVNTATCGIAASNLAVGLGALKP